MTTPQDDLRVYFARVRPVYCELFAIAHAILGNYELAEYAVQRAILDGWQRSQRFTGKLGFREALRSDVKRIAYAEALLRRNERPEFTWNGLAPDAIDGAADEPFAQLAAQESPDGRRILALRYGCGFFPAAIARLVEMPVGQVRQTLYRFEGRLRRRLRGSWRHKVEAYCFQTVREEFARPESNLPDPGTVYRTFQVEASQAVVPHGRLRKFLYCLASVALIALIGAVFWLAAVLVQAPMLEEDSENTIANTPAPVATNQESELPTEQLRPDESF